MVSVYFYPNHRYTYCKSDVDLWQSISVSFLPAKLLRPKRAVYLFIDSQTNSSSHFPRELWLISLFSYSHL